MFVCCRGFFFSFFFYFFLPFFSQLVTTLFMTIAMPFNCNSLLFLFEMFFFFFLLACYVDRKGVQRKEQTWRFEW